MVERYYYWDVSGVFLSMWIFFSFHPTKEEEEKEKKNRKTRSSFSCTESHSMKYPKFIFGLCPNGNISLYTTDAWLNNCFSYKMQQELYLNSYILDDFPETNQNHITNSIIWNCVRWKWFFSSRVKTEGKKYTKEQTMCPHFSNSQKRPELLFHLCSSRFITNDSSSFKNRLFYGLYATDSINGFGSASISTWTHQLDFCFYCCSCWCKEQTKNNFSANSKLHLKMLSRGTYALTTHIHPYIRVELQFSVNIKWFSMMQSAFHGSILQRISHKLTFILLYAVCLCSFPPFFDGEYVLRAYSQTPSPFQNIYYIKIHQSQAFEITFDKNKMKCQVVC